MAEKKNEKRSEKKSIGSAVKSFLNHVFIDGLSGMALGLFSTLIVGTILSQVATLFSGAAAEYIGAAASIAKMLTGAGIGVGVACKFKKAPLVTVATAVAGMVGANAALIINGTLFTQVAEKSVFTPSPVGEPVGAFVAAYFAAELGGLVSGKTKLDILLTPIVTIAAGSVFGLLVGPGVSKVMTYIGSMINWGTEQQPFIMGVVVAVLMGIALTLPISSAAIGVSLGLSGIAAGAAVVGCSAQMIGFAVMSYRENKIGGLIAQGVGTSMLQMPNIIKRPIVWLPPIIASAILGPVSSCFLKMTSNSTGAGMGTSGFVGQIMTYQTMTAAGEGAAAAVFEIIIMHFVAPAILVIVISEFMCKKGWIRQGDLKLPE